MNYLICGMLSSFCLKNRFWAILKDFDFAVYCSFLLLGTVKGKLKILQNRFWGEMTTMIPQIR